MINRELLIEKIQDAQMILIGIGEEFEGKKRFQENIRYIQIEEELKNNERYMWMLPYIQREFINQDNREEKALLNLKGLIEGKNYFIVTTCMNEMVNCVGFKDDRVVSPCGGYAKMQCRVPACEYIGKTPDTLLAQIKEYIAGKRKLSEIDEIVCPQCGAVMEFNSLYSENYKEAGYMKDWETYTKWLQGTLNRKVCVLELGVSLKFPSVIRFPFEKIAFFNQKAEFIRINEKLYQLSEELGGKGISHAGNSVDFLNQL